MVEWSRAFGGVPIYLHAADRQWVMRPDKAIVFWEGETRTLGDGLTLIRCGGHFEGGTVLHWAGGAGGKGALLTGDIIQVVADRKHVSFMYCYPNYIPLSASAIERIVKAVEPFEYDRVYGAFWDMVIERDGKAVGQAVGGTVSAGDWAVMRGKGRRINHARAARPKAQEDRPPIAAAPLLAARVGLERPTYLNRGYITFCRQAPCCCHLLPLFLAVLFPRVAKLLFGLRHGGLESRAP